MNEPTIYLIFATINDVQDDAKLINICSRSHAINWIVNNIADLLWVEDEPEDIEKIIDTVDKWWSIRVMWWLIQWMDDMVYVTSSDEKYINIYNMQQNVW